MVHVIDRSNRHLYTQTLDEMFRLRYHIAVNELGWSIPNCKNEYDKDAFDHDETIYFIDFDPQGRLIATARLNPTTRPHLMSEVFSEYCEFSGVPQSDDIYEYSRFLVMKTGVGRRENLTAQARICLAVVEYCLVSNIRQVSWISYKRSYPLALRMWHTRPLGLPRLFIADQKEYIAAISDMTEDSLNRTRNLAGIYTNVIDSAPAPLKHSLQTNQTLTQGTYG